MFSLVINCALSAHGAHGGIVKGGFRKKIIIKNYSKNHKRANTDWKNPTIFLRWLSAALGSIFKTEESGSPIKGASQEKKHLSYQKNLFFSLGSNILTSKASLYHLFSHPLFLSYRFSDGMKRKLGQ